MAEKNDVVLRISNPKLGTVEWTLPVSVQEMFREVDAAIATEPEAIQALLRSGRDELISLYTEYLHAFLFLLVSCVLLPPVMTQAACDILCGSMSQAISDMRELLCDLEMTHEISH